MATDAELLILCRDVTNRVTELVVARQAVRSARAALRDAETVLQERQLAETAAEAALDVAKKSLDSVLLARRP